MKSAYLTNDRANADHLAKCAPQFGCELVHLTRLDQIEANEGLFDEIFIDYENVLGLGDDAIALAIRAGFNRIVIHAYGLDDGDIVAMAARGVEVYRSLNAEMFQKAPPDMNRAA